MKTGTGRWISLLCALLLFGLSAGAQHDKDYETKSTFEQVARAAAVQFLLCALICMSIAIFVNASFAMAQTIAIARAAAPMMCSRARRPHNINRRVCKSPACYPRLR